MTKSYKKEWLLVFLFVIVAIFVRSIHFPQHFNFSSEQASASLKTLQLWQSKKIELIGPPISFNFKGRYIFQGSAANYVMMLFLVPTHFDPLVATYLFVLFASFSLVPLYYGVKFLINKPVAIVMMILYSLIPFYIDFTRFFWNPTFQFAITPYLILSMGLYAKQKRSLWLFLTGFLSGFLLLFHYQYVLIIVSLVVYYRFFKKESLKNCALFLAGIAIGFSPLILFDLRNDFYNLQTVLLFLQNHDVVFGKNGPTINYYYFLSYSLLVWMALLSYVKNKIKTVYIVVLTAFLFVAALIIYGPKPSHAYGMAKNWNYLSEKKMYEIIKNERLTNYNIVNLGYDIVAVVPKFLLTRDGVSENFDDYYHNAYLYVLSLRTDFMNDPHAPYETNTFRPSTVVKTWKINEMYTLYLLRREK